MISIDILEQKDSQKWDSFIRSSNHSSVYHLHFFKTVIEKTYHHKSYYLVASEDNVLKGVLPLFVIKSPVFGNALVSLPFCDYGGIVTSDDTCGRKLLDKAAELAVSLKISEIEFRQTNEQKYFTDTICAGSLKLSKKTGKVRMKLELPDNQDALFSTFPAKLRSQIRRPQKENCTGKNGGVELLDDFYDVFVHNMRDLGSPVHSKALMRNMLEASPDNRLFVIYHNATTPVACSMVCGFNDMAINPWASFKRTYQKISPNMLLYWEMLCYSIEKKYKYFDFGRSTPGEGTFKFKEQWGAKPEQLFWYHYNTRVIPEDEPNGKKEKFIKVWSKLPLPVTRVLGPVIRRQVHL